jgi:hypothetical protein
MKLTYEQYSKLTPQLKEEYEFLKKSNNVSVLSMAAVANTFILMYISTGFAMKSLGVASTNFFHEASTIALLFLAFAALIDISSGIFGSVKLHEFKKRAKDICPHAFKR